MAPSATAAATAATPRAGVTSRRTGDGGSA
jgi:hypothetical protein